MLSSGAPHLVLSFWKDANGGSPARSECQSLRAAWQREVNHILAHVSAVERVGSLTNNRHLKQAQHNPGTAPHPDLYWWEVNGVGAFYADDGTDLVIVLMGRVGNPPTYGALLLAAEGRL
jgi:hypothetical protein